MASISIRCPSCSATEGVGAAPRHPVSLIQLYLLTVSDGTFWIRFSTQKQCVNHHHRLRGWSMSPRMTAQLACDALQMALWRRKRPRNVIVHTDRGGQYCSADYQAQLKRHNLRGSMSAKGCCYDNACVESFFHSLKVECIHGEHFISREIMRATVFNYIECDFMC